MESKRLDSAARAAGIGPSYINAHGKPQTVSAETRRRLLDAMHGAAAPAAERPVPEVRVFTVGKKMSLPVGGKGEYRWLLTTEAGRQFQGQAVGGRAMPLPASLPEGYHTLTLIREGQRLPCRIIVAPKRCYEPPALLNGQKLWGACVQLYTLRSDHNWGIGDFSDLRAMLTQVAKRGGSFIGLNPIHALYPANPESASPYSPSSRRWLNVIYIDVGAVEDFQHSEEAQAWWQTPDTRLRLRQAREAEWVDYSAVTALKITALRMAWKRFARRDDAQMAAFRLFVGRQGESLYWHAAFDALHARQAQEEEGSWGWPTWPEAYRSVDSPAVKAFCEAHRDEVDFYLWLQWLAYTQFAACWEVSRGYGMPVGLYRDLAVGVAEGGAETWCDRELYCLNASVGAPPDILGPLGQNWGLPPMDPHVIAARGYEPFIELLRANMQNCGALRIDHVMSLLRLWWIPRGETADRGAYVHYPVDDLLAILALESQRHRCMVIGEDLGTVPEEIVGKLRDGGVYSYKVLFFEHDAGKRFRAPQTWPTQSMAVATTHDLPTVRGYWDGGDLALGKTLGLYPDEALLRGLYQDRALAKQGLLEALHQHGCLPKRAGHKASLMSMTPTLSRGMQRYLADCNSALLGLQPEDWLNMAVPVNVPGTSSQYKNWRRKLTVSLEAMFADDGVNRLIKDLDKRRKAAAKRK
ncbi:4-alpha-glucanotransferase [Intestinirhabdus alba]|jgi:4-alpha-glucanotransferase|uniref:4-alpha-glucanotransferase n=1 Tax=Intestinirhabdus alba TaxID=2899544 RepID=A0A6L6IPS3_9ENTR|nr:4-alpha-glucanotransferase [Intestinirhabdus alba]MTH48509.1 4-alpha-glucanotransferase [Intestinirhabdus alba]